MLSPRSMRGVVADITELPIANGSNRVVTFIHATAKQKHVIARRNLCLDCFAKKRPTLVMAWNRHTCQAEQRCRQIDETDRVVNPLTRLGGSQMRPFFGKAHHQRNT